MLVVDDQEINRDVLGIILEDDYEVVYAENGQEAVDIMQAVDAGREQCVKRFAGTSRYDARNYDLVLRADGHTEEELANLILAYIR